MYHKCGRNLNLKRDILGDKREKERKETSDEVFIDMRKKTEK